MAQLRPLNITDMTGGLNLRADAYSLAENESPEMLNVDPDPRGGVRSRRRWTNFALPDSSPLSMHLWRRRTGGSILVTAANNGHMYQIAATRPGDPTSPPTMTQVLVGAASVGCNASIHGAQFVEWTDKLYIACGRTGFGHRWSGSGSAVALAANGPTWQNDYTAPVGGHFPRAEHATTYGAYMVTANTQENGFEYPNRVRFSHPNNPENWAELDFIDIEAGGSHITGLVAFSDHVVVFKTASVWAIYGHDADTFTPVNLSPDAGAPHRKAIALATDSVFFYSHPLGVLEYMPDRGVAEVSAQLRPIFDSGELNPTALGTVALGWLGRRLWFGAPYQRGGATPSYPKTVFVYDPQLSAWTAYQGGVGDGSPEAPSPGTKGLSLFATGESSAADPLLLAYHPDGAIVEVDSRSEEDIDYIFAYTIAPETVYATRWLHAGWPALRKSWRRPDYIVSELPADYALDVDVRRDYDEAHERSTHTVTVATDGEATWGEFVWGDGTTYGMAAEGARIMRGGSIGLARSVQLVFRSSDQWQLNQIIMKFRARRFR